MEKMKVVISIAGSDSGGGAGIQADLKSFASLGVFGTTAIAALTAQNSQRVTGVYPVDPAFVASQIDAVASDMPIAAVKIGMLQSREVIAAVAAAIDRHQLPNVVLDPVMVATSGDPLLEEDAVDAIQTELMPKATLLTPNLPEAGMLLGRTLGHDDEALAQAARDLVEMGASAVVVKGGHRTADADDVFFDGQALRVLSAERIVTSATHGSGCTLSSAIAAFLARGRSVEDAVVEAKEYVTAGIRQGLTLGQGNGCLHHFHEYYGSEGLP
jgi:hydroxymethylpyrimidine/phosphomethylpyrimidine kinase